MCESLKSSKGIIYPYRSWTIIYQKLWLHNSWFTYSQKGSLWLQWGLSYFFVFIFEASKTIREY